MKRVAVLLWWACVLAIDAQDLPTHEEPNTIGGEEALEADVANLLKKRARRESSRNTVGTILDPGLDPGPPR